MCLCDSFQFVTFRMYSLLNDTASTAYYTRKMVRWSVNNDPGRMLKVVAHFVVLCQLTTIVLSCCLKTNTLLFSKYFYYSSLCVFPPPRMRKVNAQWEGHIFPSSCVNCISAKRICIKSDFAPLLTNSWPSNWICCSSNKILILNLVHLV